MNRTAAALLAAVLLFTACDSGPDLAACEQAMRDQFDAAMATGEEGTRPPECDGVSDEDVARIGTEILGDFFEEATP